ncbi:MAG: cleavage polyadenylation factor subunit fip1 [Geoglossum simile]|nr:MAG: cleavage polyadenylation factor subunit fip1 [Geoglossum simile]
MEEEDDDFYAPSEPVVSTSPAYPAVSDSTAGSAAAPKEEKVDDELEEGEEEEEEEVESDSDIDIITDRKDGSKPEPPPQKSRYSNIRNLPARTVSSDAGAKTAVKAETPAKDTKVVEHPAVATSTLNISDKPVYLPAGKPITEVNIDSDLAEHEKPWRRPGSDVTDYFNYGFDEFTWTAYCEKQTALREEFDPKKMMEQMAMMTQQLGLGIPGMPPVPSGPGGGASGQSAMQGPGGNAMMNMPPMPGMEGIPPEMQAMMAQFLAQGGDLSQMDPSMFGAMQQAGAGQGGGSGVQGQGFGGGQQQGYGQAQGQGQQGIPGYGYDPSIMGDGGRNRGNFGGRGRGGRRNW